ncbi:MAG TPA: hypothetical protein VFH54_16990 [Mycobacteriales bacterium]|nr:hypothetical protein [Mycobacteriales bacterium]
MTATRGVATRITLALLALLVLSPATLGRASPPSLGCDDSGYVDSLGHCSPLHPGDSVSFPGFYCTLNFLWVDPRGNRYFGTAGHCTLGIKIGAVASDGLGRPIGHLVYSVWNASNDAEDFALIRLNAHVTAASSMRHWGGPTRTFTGYTGDPSTLCFFGQADGLADAAAARNLITTSVTQPEIVLVNGVISFGDSGAPVIMPDGQALGWVESIADSYHLPASIAHGGVELGEEVVTRIGPAVASAEKALHTKLRLLTDAHPHCSLMTP